MVLTTSQLCADVRAVYVWLCCCSKQRHSNLWRRKSRDFRQKSVDRPDEGEGESEEETDEDDEDEEEDEQSPDEDKDEEVSN